MYGMTVSHISREIIIQLTFICQRDVWSCQVAVIIYRCYFFPFQEGGDSEQTAKTHEKALFPSKTSILDELERNAADLIREIDLYATLAPPKRPLTALNGTSPKKEIQNTSPTKSKNKKNGAKEVEVQEKSPAKTTKSNKKHSEQKNHLETDISSDCTNAIQNNEYKDNQKDEHSSVVNKNEALSSEVKSNNSSSSKFSTSLKAKKSVEAAPEISSNSGTQKRLKKDKKPDKKINLEDKNRNELEKSNETSKSKRGSKNGECNDKLSGVKKNLPAIDLKRNPKTKEVKNTTKKQISQTKQTRSEIAKNVSLKKKDKHIRGSSESSIFSIDCSQPASDGILDVPNFVSIFICI